MGSSSSGKDLGRGIFERPEGSGVFWVLFYDQFGRRHREKVGSLSAAREVYAQRKTEVRLRKFDPEDVTRRKVLTVEQLVKRYMPEIRANKRSWKDDERYGRFWTEFLGHLALDQVRPEDVERWKVKRLQERTRRGGGATPATVNRGVAFLKRLFNLAIRDGLAEKNPVSRVRMLRENNSRIRYLTEAEEDRLREFLEPVDLAAVEFAMHTGLRQSEQFGLRRQDVDLRLNIVTIRRSKHGEKRHVPLNGTARAALDLILASHSSPWVFPAKAPRAKRDGTKAVDGPRDGSSASRCILAPALSKAGIEDFHWHDLRHTFCSRLVMAGVDIRTVQQLAGHKTITITMRYSHLSPGHQRDAVRALDSNSHQNSHRENVVSLEARRSR